MAFHEAMIWVVQGIADGPFPYILGIPIVYVAFPNFCVCCGVANCGCRVSMQVPQRAEPQQEFKTAHGGVQGSWGAWGPWSTCSRTCGGGVQEQTRPCLPVYSPSQHPSRRPGAHHQHLGHVVSALRPTVPLHHGTVVSPNSNDSSRGELQNPHRETEVRPGGRRYSINPGRVMGMAQTCETN